ALAGKPAAFAAAGNSVLGAAALQRSPFGFSSSGSPAARPVAACFNRRASPAAIGIGFRVRVLRFLPLKLDGTRSSGVAPSSRSPTLISATCEDLAPVAA